MSKQKEQELDQLLPLQTLINHKYKDSTIMYRLMWLKSPHLVEQTLCNISKQEEFAQFLQDPQALFKLGVEYDEKKKYAEAVACWEAAAAFGHAVAQNNIGYCYRYGLGVTKDEKRAVEW